VEPRERRKQLRGSTKPRHLHRGCHAFNIANLGIGESA